MATNFLSWADFAGNTLPIHKDAYGVAKYTVLLLCDDQKVLWLETWKVNLSHYRGSIEDKQVPGDDFLNTDRQCYK